MYRYFEDLIDPLRPRAVVRPPTSTVRFFWSQIRPVSGVIAAALLLVGIAAVAELYVYAYLGRILDWMSASSAAVDERGDFLAAHKSELLWMLLVVAFIRPVALVISRALITLALAPGLANTTRWQNHRYVLRQSMTFFQNDFAGRISQKVMQTGNALREAVLNVIDGAWMLLIYLIGTAAMFTGIDIVLLLPIGLWVVAYAAVVWLMVPPVRNKSAALSEATSSLTGRVVDSYTNIQAVKLFAHHRLEEDFAAEAIRGHTHRFQVLMRAVLQMTIVLTALNTVLIVAMALLSMTLWMQGSLSVGQIAIANGLVIRLSQMSGWILRTITSLFENIGTVENGVQTIAQAQEVVDEPDASLLRVPTGKIQFDAVSFRYELVGAPPDAPPARVKGEALTLPIIDDITLAIKGGEKLGLVGRSGAGKSTLINLLMRFHDPQCGLVSIDGQDIRTVTQRSLRSQIAVVTQDTSLLHRSIRDNIRYGRPEASDEAVVLAAEQAAAMGFIPDLSDPQGRRGLDAHVGERGVKLSGGQRQRIAIARVILKDAPILVLDEATSALDSEVEAAIQEQLTHLMQGKTVIAIAHRLSTIAALDRLVVLDAGGIVETGTHDQLLARDSLYARLWQRQSGGFLGL